MRIIRPVATWIAAIATTAAFVVLLMPASAVPPSWFRNQDKVEHALLFATLCALWRWAGVPPLRVLGCAVAVAIGTEILQAEMGLGRTGDVLDALADTSGAVLGLVAWALITRRRRR